MHNIGDRCRRVNRERRCWWRDSTRSAAEAPQAPELNPQGLSPSDVTGHRVCQFRHTSTSWLRTPAIPKAKTRDPTRAAARASTMREQRELGSIKRTREESLGRGIYPSQMGRWRAPLRMTGSLAYEKESQPATTAAGAGPASTSCFVTGSTRKLSPSRVREPSKVRSPGSPKTTSSPVRFPATLTTTMPVQRSSTVPLAWRNRH